MASGSSEKYRRIVEGHSASKLAVNQSNNIYNKKN